MRGYPASSGGIQASAGGLVDDVDRGFYDPFDDPSMFSAYYERSTGGTIEYVDGAGFHTNGGLRFESFNHIWTLPGSGFGRYPDTGEWVMFLFTIDSWQDITQIWLPVFGDPGNEGDRQPCYEIQFINSSETFRIQSRDNSDNRDDVATDAESDQSYSWLSTDTAYATGIYRDESGQILGGLWNANDDYPNPEEAIAYIDSEDHPFDDGSDIDGIGPDDGPGRWGVRTGEDMVLDVHEVEHAEPVEGE